MLQQNSVALITGAARGVGWGIARAFGIAGARVCATDIGGDELARCARDLAADGTEYVTCLSDVADLAECRRVVKTIVDRWGRLDVVVHNAIYMPLITFEATRRRSGRGRSMSASADCSIARTPCGIR